MTIEGNVSVQSVKVSSTSLFLTVENTVRNQATRIIWPAILRCDGLAVSIVYLISSSHE